MTITQADIIGKIRKAIDDIVQSGVTDTFVTDTDAELWQAVFHACMELSVELPLNLLDVTNDSLTGSTDTARGSAYAALADNYLRFVSLRITGCTGVIWELMEPGGDEEKMQRSPWTRGTSTKPKAMLDHSDGAKVVVWWPGDSSHTMAELVFIASPSEENDEIACAIRDEAERLIIYRAASIFFEGKKEETIAEKFRQLSTNY